MPYHAILTGLLLATDETTEPAGSLLGLLLPLIIFGGLFYVALILPQRRRQKQMQQLRSSIVVGDQIRTIDGLSTRDLSLQQSRRRLGGEPGSSVKLGLVRPRPLSDRAMPPSLATNTVWLPPPSYSGWKRIAWLSGWLRW